MRILSLGMDINDITEEIIGAAIDVHRELGPGLLESAYHECLFFELKERGLKVEKELRFPIEYKGVEMEVAYRVDLLVEEEVVVEVKAVKAFEDIHAAQVLNYLKLTNCEIGLLFNFNVKKLMVRDVGYKRLLNKYFT